MRSIAIRRVLYLIALLNCILFVSSCGSQPESTTPTPSIPASSSTPPLNATVAISKINDAAVDGAETLRVGMQVTVEGTVSEPDAHVCVAAHGTSNDIWFVQSLPGPAVQADSTWRWHAPAVLGGKDQGVNEDFEIVAIAENGTSICAVGKTFKTQEFPQDLPHSKIVKVRRDRT